MKACEQVMVLAAAVAISVGAATAQDKVPATTQAAGSATAQTTTAVRAPAVPEDQAAELAKKLANPVAALISLPFQYNYDTDYGVEDNGTKHFINIQPVIPIPISENWNIISRTILPVISQTDLPTGTDKSGIGDVLQTVFFSPRAPTSRGLIWGAGPAILLPTASDEVLGGGKWGVGPSVVFLKQQGPWTAGFLANHVWSVGGTDGRADVNATYLQPFVTRLFKRTLTTIAFNSESTYNWDGELSSEAWSVPFNLTANQMFKVGKQRMQFTLGARYWADSPEAGPERWGARAQLVLLFPK